jgi:predicted dienelactone hydrolase
VKLVGVLLAVAFAVAASAAEASVGLTDIAGQDGAGVVTVYYPSTDEAKIGKRGPFLFEFAWQGAPARGNWRLIVISHRSGGSPWVHANLAQALVADGFVVATPEHRGENYKDPSTPGPESWKRRPAEVSGAIDVVSQDARFGPLLALDKVGMYGMSAGGHTALSLAGGRWSPARFAQHCEAHLAEDFQTCVERLADFATGGHGALLSPLPPGLTGLVGELLNDPPGFDRAELPGVDRKISAFFRKLLLP